MYKLLKVAQIVGQPGTVLAGVLNCNLTLYRCGKRQHGWYRKQAQNTILTH